MKHGKPEKPVKRGPVKFKHKRPPALFKLPKIPQHDLTKLVIMRLSKALASGVPMSMVAQLIGVPRSRMRYWKAKGEALDAHLQEHLDYPPGTTPEDILCHTFFQAMDTALAKSSEAAIKSVRRGMAHDWRAGAWWLAKQVGEFKEVELGQTSIENAQVVIYLPQNPRGPNSDNGTKADS